MDTHIFIALIGALLNMGLSVTVPCLINESKQPFLNQVKTVYKTHRQVILTSSLIVAVTIYLALKVAPGIQPGFSNLTGINFDSSSEFSRPSLLMTNEMPYQLRNLVKLSNM